MKLFAAIRQSVRRTPPPQRGARRVLADRTPLDAAVRRQEHYNFLHYDGTTQPDPIESIHPSCPTHQDDRMMQHTKLIR